MLPVYGELNDRERNALERLKDRARDFAEALAPDEASELVTLDWLDRAYENYVADDGEGFPDDEVAEVLGVALGSVLVEELGFRWVTVTDDYGKELGILARPGRGDVTIFPIEFAEKRHEVREAPFLVDARKQIERTMLEIAEEWGDFG